MAAACCSNPPPASASSRETVHSDVKVRSTWNAQLRGPVCISCHTQGEYYGEVLKKKEDLKTSACTAAGRPNAVISAVLAKVPDEVLSKFFGCGNPIPMGIQGLRVLDLGCGTGRDCYVAAALVGADGSVTGLDMTRSQLDVAERNVEAYQAALGYSANNMRFVEGYLEDLEGAGLARESIDLIISNCVINLSPDKERVFREAYRVLAVGGEFYFSDMYMDRRVPEKARQDKAMWGEGVGGALYINDFLRVAKAAGFTYPVMASLPAPIAIHDPAMRAVLGNVQAYSVTYRLFKLPGLLEPDCEDYGQVVIYKGTIPGHELEYQLDVDHTFEKGRIVNVCGNTAAILGEGGLSWLAPHFHVLGDRTTHFGRFSGSSAPSVPAAQPLRSAGPPLQSNCC